MPAGAQGEDLVFDLRIAVLLPEAAREAEGDVVGHLARAHAGAQGGDGAGPGPELVSLEGDPGEHGGEVVVAGDDLDGVYLLGVIAGGEAARFGIPHAHAHVALWGVALVGVEGDGVSVGIVQARHGDGGGAGLL